MVLTQSPKTSQIGEPLLLEKVGLVEIGFTTNHLGSTVQSTFTREGFQIKALRSASDWSICKKQ